MSRFQTHHDYMEYVRMLARNGIQMGVGPETVAEVAIVATENVGDEKALRFSSEPYVDNPATQERLWPKDVVHGAMRDMPADWPDELRPLAVRILTEDLKDAVSGVDH